MRRPGSVSDTTLFLLSPAFCGGRRAQTLLRPDAQSELAVRLRAGEATLGEAFAFISGLYFRGKLAYARRFARPEGALDGVQVITSNRGLLPAATPILPDDLHAFAAVPIDAADPRYARPMIASLRQLADTSDAPRVVLLGSIATRKYVEMLIDFLGDRLCFPERFVGMGDMQRGSLLLKAAERGEELRYVRARGAMRSTVTKTPGGSRE